MLQKVCNASYTFSPGKINFPFISGAAQRHGCLISKIKAVPTWTTLLIQILGNTSKGGKLEHTIPLSCQLTLCPENYSSVLSKLYGDKPPRGIRRILR